MDVIISCYARVDAGDVEGLVALFAPDVVYDRPGGPTLTGRAAVREFYLAQPPMRSRRHVLTTVLRERDGVAVHGRADRVHPDGTEDTVHFADFFTLSGAGLITYRRTFFFIPLR